MIRILALAVVAIALALPASAEDSTKPIEPFNGKDLTGWKPKDEKKHQWRLMRVVVNDKEPAVGAGDDFNLNGRIDGDRGELILALDEGGG